MAAAHRLADPDVVRNEHADGVELERHQEGHELVGARLDGNPRERTKRTSARAEPEAHRIAKQAAGQMVPHVAGRIGQIEL
ncbi:MAG: hypothetical protein MJD61_04570, partial [Proteobacteria bacterium]|nr:hypothetical protein [Pseudomonadota bacterium]